MMFAIGFLLGMMVKPAWDNWVKPWMVNKGWMKP